MLEARTTSRRSHRDHPPSAAGSLAAAAASRPRSASSDENVVEVLKSTARKPGTDLRGVYDPAYGYGIVDAEAAAAAPQG